MRLFALIAFAFLLGAAPVMAAEDLSQTADSGTLKRADGDMKEVLDQLRKLDGKPIETLDAATARQQPTPADAVTARLRKDGKDPVKLTNKLKVSSRDLEYPTAGGTQKIRIYIPDNKKADETLPVIVYYHGGGFVIATIDTYDATPRSIARLANAIVVSPEYRHAPEHKFPAAWDDANAAYQWVLQNAAAWGGDPKRIAVMGESAGGNLAINVAINARDKGLQMPAHMALIYPVAGTDTETVSYKENVNAIPLNKAMMLWFVSNTINSDADKQDTRLNVLGADLKFLPPTTIVTADIDPLRSDGKSLTDKLKQAGVNVDYKNYEGVAHEFFGMALVVDKAKAAQKFVADNLKTAFGD